MKIENVEMEENRITFLVSQNFECMAEKESKPYSSFLKVCMASAMSDVLGKNVKCEEKVHRNGRRCMRVCFHDLLLRLSGF